MKKTISALVPAAFLVLGIHAQGAPTERSPWALAASPAFTLPLVAGDFSANEQFASSWGAKLEAARGLPTRLPLALALGLEFSSGALRPMGAVPVDDRLQELSLSAGLSAGGAFGPARPRAVAGRAFVQGGLALGSLGESGVKAYGLVRAGGGLDLALGRALVASLDAAWIQKSGLYGGLGVSLGLGYRLPAAASRPEPAGLKLLELTDLDIDRIFPIFRARYDEHPVGKVKLMNEGELPARDLRVTFFVRQYMDGPKECAAIASLAPGESVELPLYALFNDRILDVTEATKATAEISVEYGAGQKTARTASVLVYDRNALTWDDDRHAAAFVSSKDPWVLDLAGSFIAAVGDARSPAAAKNIQTAIALHEGLRAYGIGYVVSPNRPFAREGGDLAAVDSLKFPRQTLGMRAGDCADLSVLYASAFESAGIESAFATVPGHIFMAFDSGLDPDQARQRGFGPGDFIENGGKAWIPVETTMRESGFTEAWRKAAQQWRTAEADGVAAFYPVHAAWEAYAPVGLPADGSTVSAPSQERVRAAFMVELGRLVAQELRARIDALSGQGLTPARLLNEEGVVYGKYGLLDEAERRFTQAADAQYAPALVNLGTITMLRSDWASAYERYSQASRQGLESARLYLNIAKAASALGKADEAARALESAKRLDPKAAEQGPALAKAGSAGTRAAEIDEGDLEWF